MGGQHHALTALPLGKRCGIHCTGGWLGLRASLDGSGNSDPPPPGFKPQTIQSVASFYTDYATTATTIQSLRHTNMLSIPVSTELPVCSPLIHCTLRIVSQWQDMLNEELDSRRPPPADYIPGCFVETNAAGPAIHKYRSLLEKCNTPFQ